VRGYCRDYRGGELIYSVILGVLGISLLEGMCSMFILLIKLVLLITFTGNILLLEHEMHLQNVGIALRSENK
jgi:hypothetical protein